MKKFDESTQIIVTRNGVTMLKPHWMSNIYWQNYMVPRCGKRYAGTGGKSFVFGTQPSAADKLSLATSLTKAVSGDDGDCESCKI